MNKITGSNADCCIQPCSSIARKTISMSDAEFYHAIVAIAGLSLPTNKYSSAPSINNAGYDFLKEFHDFMFAR